MGVQGFGPAEVRDAASAAVAHLRRALGPSAATGSREEWAQALGDLQEVVDIASAAQDEAIARLAAVEPVHAGDGTVLEVHRSPGHVAMDAPAIVSGVLLVPVGHAERRVASAVRMAADGPQGTSAATGLGGLHASMAAGRLDTHRAGVLADELELAPPDVAASVVAALEPYLDREDAPRLRRRCRRVLARISPDLLRQRAERARSESRLERWASEPGVDTWHGTFPSEEAARAWAAVDALAQRYVADGTCAAVDRARAKALTDLVEGSATIETVLTLVVPEQVVVGLDAGAAESSGVGPPEHAAQGRSPGPPAGSSAVTGGTAELPGAGRAGPGAGSSGGARGGAASRVSASDEPAGGTLSATRHPGDVPQVVGEPVGGRRPRVPGPDDLVGAAGPRPGGPVGGRRPPVPRPDDLVEVAGLRPGEPVLVPGSWLAAAVAACSVTGRDRLGRGRLVSCHPGTGGLGDPTGELSTPAYRPGDRLAALVRLRDGRCRFPGCSIAARFCDLDHARPWPLGPTAASNLLCLCRRHHRTKQRPGWRLQLGADGTARWTDPTGRTRTTAPVDALDVMWLPAVVGAPLPAGGGTPTAPSSRARTVLPDGPHTPLEFGHEHRLAGRWDPTPRRVDHHVPDLARWCLADAPPPHRPHHPRRRHPPDADDPPF